NNPRALTQTGYWLDIEKKMGHQAYIIFTTKDKQITSSALLIKHPLSINKNYLYCPYGPVVNKDLPAKEIPNIIKELMREIRKFIDLSNTIFIRFEPFHQDCHCVYHSLQSSGFKATNHFTQPKDTLILNLLQSEDEILKNMKQKTRYNIRLAERKGVEIEKSTDPIQVELFHQLLLNTCDRDNFRPHPLEHYLNIIDVLGPQKIAYVYHAKYKNKIIASNIITSFGRIATYLHGASSNTYRNLMPTYLLQWRAIQDAIQQGCRFYDFGGIAPPEANDQHPWHGITKFKTGFGGIPITTTGHMEKTISLPWHLVYKTAKFIQR
ncbi:peptidoglycan bridge formation glycyltransferase FemA/FemB family protein, partial [Patescibacteria group bacterium]|nr:peptidoglycan bridge formation glycyltransferase FemA/FemB family protein [Patescibacteria group bacterium]